MLVSGATALEKELLACRIVFWLRENYRLGRSGSLAKEEVYGDYLNSMEPNKTDPVIVPTYFGKLVKKAFPSVRCNRKGPRGKAKQHYTHLQRVDHQREAERQRFNSFALTEQAAPSATKPTATTSASLGGPKHAPFQSYISSELSYLNYLLKKADPASTAGRSGSGDYDGWVLSKPSETSSAPNTREGRTDSPAAGGMPPAMASVGEADGDKRDWDWVFVHNKPQPRKKHSPSAARADPCTAKNSNAHKRDRDARSGSDEDPEEAEGAGAKRRRGYAEEANGADRREEQRAQQSAVTREFALDLTVFSVSFTFALIICIPLHFFFFFLFIFALRSLIGARPSSASPARPAAGHSSIAVVSPADIRDGETQSPPCPTGYINSNSNDPSQSGQYLGLPFNTSSPFTCSSFSSSSFSSTTALSWPQNLSTTSSFAGPSTSSLPQPPSLATCSPEFSGSPCPPEFFASWHSLSSSSSPALQSSSAALPSASYHSQLLSDIEPYDYHQHQHQQHHQHRSQQEPSYHYNSHQQHQQHQRCGEVPAYYGHSGAVSNYAPLPPRPMSSAPMSYHTGTYLDPQPTHTNPVLQHSRALCGDEADRGFAPLKFGGAGTPVPDHHRLPPGYPNRTPFGSYNPHSAFSHFSSHP
ncbi:uncharacterized protein ACA1_282340 [Acanthamoeba castellanii str. Neff]|uniref:RFX-type winged-helix domain-containing protein n=1 Tax=Acanthamoeba castellanii (strain ATCC 30010 / Neff) TaxID=1257118 RepID=L8H6E3_ACACF|nr:uncharacterized protein ACA1_282340 [Acanthamoeba castellanii str. Neff]ELR21069.1 hypothetical protein ACA1_282340 [Acanthamoeba castellanii str. Neff]